jgi:hypothetical protein
VGVVECPAFDEFLKPLESVMAKKRTTLPEVELPLTFTFGDGIEAIALP